MKGRASAKWKARKPSAGRPRRGCRDCKFRAPSGACRDTAIKSGRCGDWVWWVRGSKQHRRRYVRPNDRRTRKQRRWRARLAAVSADYDRRLTDEQQEACIAQGAKLRSRSRLGPPDRLSGLQYWVRKELKGKSSATKAKKARAAQVVQRQRLARRAVLQVPRPQKVTRPTWEISAGVARISGALHRPVRTLPTKISG
jgi:hypothetical protein